MYGVAGEKRPDAFLYNIDDPTYTVCRNRVVQLCPPARPYIKKSFEGILMYDLAGDYINKYFNYADPDPNN